MSTLQQDSSPRPYNLQDDELTQECRDFISSLPTEDSLSQYKGFWIPHSFIQGVLAFQKYFQAHDTDILLATSPKVGTTWLKAILFALVNRMHHHVDHQEHPLLKNNPHSLVPHLDLNLYNKKEVPDLTSFTAPRLFSTHSPYVLLPTSVKNSTCKIVYLCRNPKDTFVSLWHFQTKLNWTTDSLEEALDKFCRGVSPFGPYWDNVVGYWKESLENPQKILFLRYEEMKEQSSTHLRRLAEFLGCPFSQEEDVRGAVDDISRLCSFDNLSNLEVNKSGVSSQGVNHAAFFRRGEVGGWVNYFTPQMEEKLDGTIEEKFHAIGLKF